MSIFSSLQWGGSGLSGGFYALSVDTISDWGWSLLPSFPGSIRPSPSSGSAPEPRQSRPAVIAPVPVALPPQTWGIEEETTYVPPVRARQTGTGGGPQVPRTVVVVEGVSTEVERHNGDFPAGSIFAPGQTWGVSTDLDTAPDIQEDDMALGDILDWGLSTLAGQQPWQIGWGGPQAAQQANFGPVATIPPPSGIPGQPSTVYGYTGGTAVTSGGDCGNRRYVTLDRETGKISCKRRRRRRLLTNRDLADLASLKTITGGGAALNSAVIRAVR